MRTEIERKTRPALQRSQNPPLSAGFWFLALSLRIRNGCNRRIPGIRNLQRQSRKYNGDANAGLALARMWLATTGPETAKLRLKAIDVLEDIGNENAVRTLQTVVAGKDQNLAQAAQMALAHINARKKGGH
jgi:hypothetical protein